VKDCFFLISYSFPYYIMSDELPIDDLIIEEEEKDERGNEEEGSEKKEQDNFIEPLDDLMKNKKKAVFMFFLFIVLVILGIAGIVLGYLFIIYLGICSVTVFWHISHELKETKSSIFLKIPRTILYFFAGPYNIVRYKKIYGTYNLFS
jgi:hypothetical protein